MHAGEGGILRPEELRTAATGTWDGFGTDTFVDFIAPFDDVNIPF